jgi:hypothetical protein
MTKLWRSSHVLAVTTDDENLPQYFRWGGETHHIDNICNQWRIHNDWWRSQIWRDYYKVETTDGYLCIIYRDLIADTWHLVRVYD